MGSKGGVPPTRFAWWVEKSKANPREVVEHLDITLGYYYQLRGGAKRPGRKLANRISALSGGLVPFDSWGD